MVSLRSNNAVKCIFENHGFFRQKSVFTQSNTENAVHLLIHAFYGLD